MPRITSGVAFACTVVSLAAALAGQDPIGRVEGTVLGPLGEPAIGCPIRITTTDDGTVLGRTTTDAGGTFVVGRLPTEGHVYVLAQAEGTTVAREAAELTVDAPSAGATLRLWPASGIRGRVVDAEGQPVAGAAVIATKDRVSLSGSFVPPESLTDEGGGFELRGVPIGDQVVRVWAPGHALLEHRLVSDEDIELELRLRKQGGTSLAVRVEGLDASGAHEVDLWMYPTRSGYGFAMHDALEHARLDASGRWSAQGLPDCEWHLQPRSGTHAFEPVRLTLEPDGAPHDVVFRATRIETMEIRGTLRDPQGRPLAGETLVSQTRNSASRRMRTPGRGTTDEQGRFVLDAPLAPDERYSIRLSGSDLVLRQEKREGHTGAHDPRYLMRYEETADPGRPLSLVAVPAAFIRTSLVDALGTPGRYRWVELQVREEHHWSGFAYATSDRDGNVAFPGVHVLDTEYRFEISGGASATVSEPFRVAAGHTVLEPIVLPANGRVQGKVVDLAGRPIAGLRLMMQNYDAASGEQLNGGSYSRVMTDREGRYTFVAVAPVGHKIRVLGPEGDYVSSTDLFAVEPGQTVELDITADQR